MKYELHREKYLNHIAFAETVDNVEYSDWKVVAIHCSAYHFICAEHVKRGRQPLKPNIQACDEDLIEELRAVASDYVRLSNRSKMALYSYFRFGEKEVREATKMHANIVAHIEKTA